MPGRAAPAAHPHTEFTTTKTVPSDFMAASTAAGVVRSSKPIPTGSCFMGFTIASGYMILVFMIENLSVNSLLQIYEFPWKKFHIFPAIAHLFEVRFRNCFRVFHP